MPVKTTSSKVVKEVFKTDEGYLYYEISEGWWLEDGVRNYEFTDDVFQAYDFPNYSPDHIPKYIGVTHDEDVKNKEQMCEVLKGKFVKVKIKTITTIEWEEVE